MSGVGGAGGGGGTTDGATETTQVSVLSTLGGILSKLVSGLTIVDLSPRLKALFNAIALPGWVDIALNRMRATAIVESGTVTTVTTLSNQASVGGYPAQMQIMALDVAAWQQVVRSRFT